MNTDSVPTGGYAVTVELIKVLIWPSLILLFFVVYRQPITKMIDHLPSLLAASNQLTIAGASIQIDRELRGRTTPEVLQIMAQLSPDGMERLMNMVRGTPVFTQEEVPRYHEEWQELVTLGLVEIVPWPRSDPDRDYSHSLRVTNLGRDVQQFVFVVLSEITGRVAVDSNPSSKDEQAPSNKAPAPGS